MGETWGAGELEHVIGLSWYLENDYSMTSIVVVKINISTLSDI